LPPLVSGWQLAGAAEAGGATTAAAVVGAGADGAGADGTGACDAGRWDAAEVVWVLVGCVFCTAAAGCVACSLGTPVAVAEAVVVMPAATLPPGDEGDLPEFAAAMMTMISATKARIPVSALWRAGQDLPRGGLDGCGGP
jgi:hypothetical protein